MARRNWLKHGQVPAWLRLAGVGAFDNLFADFQHLLSVPFPHQPRSERIEFQAFDDASEHLPQCPGAEAVLERGLVRDQERSFVGDGRA